MNHRSPQLIAAVLATTFAVSACVETEPTASEFREGESDLAEGATLELHVAWQGIDWPAGATPEQSTTITFIAPEDQTAVFSTGTQLNQEGGTIELDEIPTGKYRIAVQSPGYLAVVSTEAFTIEAESSIVFDATVEGAVLGEGATLCANENYCVLRAGDIDRSGSIEQIDLDLASDSAFADFDRDGIVSEDELGMIYKNLGFMTPPLTEVFVEFPGAGHCALPSAGVGETYPACLTTSWEFPEIIDCDAECAEYTAPMCNDVNGEGVSCAEHFTPDCIGCLNAFLQCRRACLEG